MGILTFICLVGVVLAMRTNHHHLQDAFDPFAIASELEAEAGATIVDSTIALWLVGYAKAMSQMCGCENF